MYKDFNYNEKRGRKSMDLNLLQGEVLVREARRAIEEFLKSGKIIEAKIPKEIDVPSGVFVTLNKQENEREELRGCIGYPEPIMKLSEALVEAAIAAATEDPRFLPVELEEMEKIIVEVSVLTSPKLINVERREDLLNLIKIGRDGLIVERGIRRGLLLPQVPVEENWDVETFLKYACLKANLPPDAYLDPRTKIYSFSARVFKEKTPRGAVVEVYLNTK
ncbi:MAG: TIGR00296 family protein [Thermoproteota archaeon]